MSEIAIGIAVIQYLPEEISALEAVAKLAGDVFAAITMRRAGNTPTDVMPTGQAAFAAIEIMASAHAAQRTP